MDRLTVGIQPTRHTGLACSIPEEFIQSHVGPIREALKREHFSPSTQLLYIYSRPTQLRHESIHHIGPGKPLLSLICDTRSNCAAISCNEPHRGQALKKNIDLPLSGRIYDTQ